MSCKIRTSSKFDKDLKKLSKRYSSFRLDIMELATQLAENPFMGTDLGGGARKVRMRIRSKGKLMTIRVKRIKKINVSSC